MKAYLTHTFSPMMMERNTEAVIKEVPEQKFVSDLIDAIKDETIDLLHCLQEKVFFENVRGMIPAIDLLSKQFGKVKAQSGDVLFAVISKEYRVHLKPMTEADVKKIKFRFFEISVL